MASRRTYPLPNKNLSGGDYISNKRAKQLFSGTSNLAKTIEQQNGNFPLLTPLGKLKPYQGTFGLSGRYDTSTSPTDKTYCLNTSHSYSDLLSITKGKYLLTPPNVSDQLVIQIQDVNDPTKLYNGIYYSYIYLNTTNVLYYMNPAYPLTPASYTANQIQYDPTGNANERIIVDPSFILHYQSQSCILRPILSPNIGINNDTDARYSFNRTINLDLFTGFQYPIKFSLDYDTGDCINTSNELQSNYAFPTPPPTPTTDVLYVAGGNYNSQYPNAIISYSDDGINWLMSTNGYSIFTTSVNDVKKNTNNLWLAAGSGTNHVAYSTDGITWTSSTDANNFLTIGNGICWDNINSRWIVVGQGISGGGDNPIIYSSNLITWTAGTDVFGGNPFGSANSIGNAIAINSTSVPAKVIAVGSSSYSCMIYSTNSNIWGDITTKPAYNMSNPAYAIHHSSSSLYPSPNGLWLVGGSAYQVGFNLIAPLYYSTDNGVVWTAVTANTGLNYLGTCYDIGWNGSYYVAVGSNIFGLYNIVHSYDGITWDSSSNGNIFSGGGARKITWQSVLQLWVAVGPTGSMVGYSSDGIAWYTGGNGSGLFANGALSVNSSTDTQ